MIYLLPVKHSIQFGRDSRSPLLQEFIEEKIKELGITLICEEASQEDLDHPSNQACVKIVAEHYKVPHLLCDLTDKERSKVGLFTAQEFYDWKQKHLELMRQYTLRGQAKQMKEKQDEFELEEQSYQRKREKAWFDKISNKKSEITLFILGVGHTSSYFSSGGDGFDKLLGREGWDYKILDNKGLYL